MSPLLWLHPSPLGASPFLSCNTTCPQKRAGQIHSLTHWLQTWPSNLLWRIIFLCGPWLEKYFLPSQPNLMDNWLHFLLFFCNSYFWWAPERHNTGLLKWQFSTQEFLLSLALFLPGFGCVYVYECEWVSGNAWGPQGLRIQAGNDCIRASLGAAIFGRRADSQTLRAPQRSNSA
jgi:hypothetical protein